MDSEPMPASKSQDNANASENDIYEPCRENMRRPKFQGYMVLESHFRRHVRTVLTFAGRHGLRAHST